MGTEIHFLIIFSEASSCLCRWFSCSVSKLLELQFFYIRGWSFWPWIQVTASVELGNTSKGSEHPSRILALSFPWSQASTRLTRFPICVTTFCKHRWKEITISNRFRHTITTGDEILKKKTIFTFNGLKFSLKTCINRKHLENWQKIIFFNFTTSHFRALNSPAIGWLISKDCRLSTEQFKSFG